MRTVQYLKQQPILSWLYAGPFSIDVSDLYDNNYKVSSEPYVDYWKEALLQASVYCSGTKEGNAAKLYGQEREWGLLRLEEGEGKIVWAGFGVYARLMTTYLYNDIIADESCEYSFSMHVCGSAAIYINGKEVLQHYKVGRESVKIDFSAELRKGANSCLIVLFNVHLHCQNTFSLWMNDSSCSAEISVTDTEAEPREIIERDFNRFFLAEDMLLKSDGLYISTEGAVLTRGEYVFSLRPADRRDEIIASKNIVFSEINQNRVFLFSGVEMGDYTELAVQIDYINREGKRICGPSLTQTRIDYFNGIPEGSFEDRKTFLLNSYTTYNSSLIKNDLIFREIAKLAIGSGEQLDTDGIEQAIDYVNRRYDCADFVLHGILRLYYLYADNDGLPKQLAEKIKSCILGFKYSEDESGKSLMFSRSENHEILFYSAEYLAGLLFPDENFTNSNQNGLFHSLKGRLKAERWIKEKGAYGFTEWHSNCYYEENVLALLNLYDFGEVQGYVRLLSKNLLDFICMIIACHSFRGILATTHGRCYEEMVIHPETESVSHLNYLLLGQPKLLMRRVSRGGAALATSMYTPDRLIEKLGNSEEELYTYTHMGLFPWEGLGGVNCSTYRKGEYMVSGMVESRTGKMGNQTHAGQVILDGNIPVFVTSFNSKSKTTRPSYWGGQFRNPKTITYKHMLVYIYDLSCTGSDTQGFTHCYFPFNLFDETEEKNGWLFGRSGNAYVAVFSLNPYIKVDTGTYKDRELLCLEKKNIWILEAGDKKQWDTFENFMNRISFAEMVRQNENIKYNSPLLGQFNLGFHITCTLDAAPLVKENFPLVKNDFCYGEYGKGLVYIKTGGGTRTLNFNI